MQSDADQTLTGLCVIALDTMEQIGIAAGPVAADRLHSMVQQQLETVFGPGNVHAHSPAHDFVAHLRNPDRGACLDMVDRALALIPRCRLDSAGTRCATTAHAGVVWADAAPSVAGLTQLAQTACVTARQTRAARFVLEPHSQPRLDETTRSALLVSDLLSAMEENRLRLYAQEIVALRPLAHPGRQYEILIQMIDREGREYPPSEFIPQSERSCLIEMLDRWVIRAALVDHAERLAQAPDISLSLNVSGRSLSHADLWSYVDQAIHDAGIAHGRVQLEITETSAIHDMDQARANVCAARRAGCHVALDDFGAGLSGFMYLKNLNVSCIKIDGALVPNVVDPTGMEAEIVRSIIALAGRLEVEVVAEHVSSPEILTALRALGVDKVQGFQVAMPMPYDQLFTASLG